MNDNDALSAYLAEIGRTPLLTASQEVALAKRIERGDLVAKDHLVRANMRLVVSIAKNYRYTGVEFSDLIQDGSVGLVRAAERFDWRFGYKFSTYATWWVRQAITRAVDDKSRAIRLPVHISGLHRRIKAAQSRLLRELGHEPTPSEIAVAVTGKETVTPEQVSELLIAGATPTSLNVPLTSGDDGTTEFGDLLADENGVSPVDAATDVTSSESLWRALGRLPYRERRILVARMGLEDDRVQTLDEVAETFQITRERVRQVELGARRLLAEMPEVQALRDEVAP